MDQISVRPAGPERWDDVVALLGQGGSVRGCWCTFFGRPVLRRRTGAPQ